MSTPIWVESRIQILRAWHSDRGVPFRKELCLLCFSPGIEKVKTRSQKKKKKKKFKTYFNLSKTPKN